MMQPPTELELMCHADGELDGPRAKEIEAWLATSAEGQAYVAGIERLGDLVREAVLAQVEPDAGRPPCDVVDEVMRAIESPPPVDSPTQPLAGGAEVVPLRAHTPRRERVLRVTMAATMAAAASVLLWLGVQRQPEQIVGAPIEPLLVASALPSALDDDGVGEDGTEVEQVDFGERGGAIFYVSGASKTATTVIWLNDDEATP